MRRTILALCVVLSAVGLMPTPGNAGEVLDRILNNMVLVVDDGSINREQWKTVSPSNPIGQTFITGSDIVEISRIAIAAGYWHESWTPEKSLVLTLWDSPSKTTRIASAEMPYKWKAWEGQVIMFPLNARVKPSTQYYFELTATGGDATIVGIYLGESYSGGAGYEAGKPSDKNLWFEVHGRPAFDRDAAYADRFSRWNLEYPGLEKVKSAVAAKNWDKAVAELVAYYEARTDLVLPTDKPKKRPDYDPTYDELALDKKIKDSDGNIVDLGPNWNHYRAWPTRGGVGLTRSGLMKNLRGGYLNSGDEKFAIGFNEMMTNMLNDMPSPIRAKAVEAGRVGINAARPVGINGGSMWSGLSIGAQMNQMWYFYSGLASSRNFTTDVRAGMIFGMVDKAEMLALEKGGGNWDSQMSTALYELADRHHELVRSKEWFDQGVTAMMANLWSISRFDGTVQEPTFNYTTLIINRFTRLLDTCKELKIPIEAKYVKRVEKALEYLMYSTEPGGDLPSRGDSFNFVDSVQQLSWGATYFGRPDFLWVATKGAQGTRPVGTSAFFPIGGWVNMRSGWSPDALYMNLHNGLNMGHGHADELSIAVDAFGSKLIVDPGCYTYGTSENTATARTKYHATVTVDDKDTVTDAGKSDWLSTSTVDYYCGTNAGYHGLDGVFHTRKIAFLKPDYWVMCDSVTGEGEHEIASRFPFFPGEISLDATTGACHTYNPVGNILVLPCKTEGLAAEKYVYGFPKSGLQPAPGVKYSKRVALPATFATALIPYKDKGAPSWTLTAVGSNGYRVADGAGKLADLVFFGSTKSAECEFGGEFLAVRTDASGRIASLVWANGTTAQWLNDLIATSDKPIKSLELILAGDTLIVRASNEEPSLKVATRGAKWIKAGNRAAVAISGAAVRPFGE